MCWHNELTMNGRKRGSTCSLQSRHVFHLGTKESDFEGLWSDGKCFAFQHFCPTRMPECVGVAIFSFLELANWFAKKRAREKSVLLAEWRKKGCQHSIARDLWRQRLLKNSWQQLSAALDIDFYSLNLLHFSHFSIETIQFAHCATTKQAENGAKLQEIWHESTQKWGKYLNEVEMHKQKPSNWSRSSCSPFSRRFYNLILPNTFALVFWYCSFNFIAPLGFIDFYPVSGRRNFDKKFRCSCCINSPFLPVDTPWNIWAGLVRVWCREC